MKKLLFILLTVCTVAFAASCEKEIRPDGTRVSVPEGQPVEMVLEFGSAASSPTIFTKSTLGEEPENMVFNLYVFIFDMDNEGKKMYGRYFDYNDLPKTGGVTSSDWWEVYNNEVDPDTGKLTSRGTIHIHTISKPHCKVVAVGNIDAEMVNISPEQLASVEKYEDIYKQKAKLNQLITSRSGYFPMSGEMPSVDTGESDSWGTLHLLRLDAKIQFRVFVDTATVNVGGEPQPVSHISEFTPLKWQVVNLPKRAYILERGHYVPGHLTSTEWSTIEDATGSSDDDYFHQGETNFEVEELTNYDYSGTSLYKKFIHCFSFYMMENRKAIKDPSNPPLSFEDRDRQEKIGGKLKPGGYAEVKNGDFIYADDKSTYVVITGRVKMDNVTYESTEGSTLSADVRYLVHLGDFSDDKFEDFNIFRNHSYTYDIIIRDVDDIRIEVSNNYDGTTLSDKEEEPEPSATGKVSVALEEIYTSDSHYSSHVITFHAKNIDAEKVSWIVETPFNPSGATPVTVNGVEVTTGIDCGWVLFRVNAKDPDTQLYINNRQVFQPHEGENADGKTMNISELVAYLKRQKTNFESNKANDFDVTDVADGGPKICVTAFVNEYYYEKNPITGEYQEDLWKSFVNQPMRFMYILSETKTSADGESQIIGASFTIQQKSIQSIYNIANPALQSAWGCEHTDDAKERGLEVYDKSGTSGNRGNTSMTNGRLNSLKEWGLVNANGTNKYLGDETVDEAYWEHYMNLEADNETPLMLPNYQYLRYSCMSRNRDNNGNGVIDKDEVRWYMGATNQLIGLFLGSYGIEGDARLYQRNVQERSSTDNEVWRQHLVASTQYSSNSSQSPRVVWAEEGMSGSDPAGSRQWSSLDKYSTRCMRNLGYDPVSKGDFTNADIASEPEFYIEMKRMRNGVEYNSSYDENVYYEFDCSRINEASLRYYTNRELVLHDEDGEQACLYKKFTVAPKKDAIIIADNDEIKNKNTIAQINDYIDKTIGLNPYCPPGYRLPNVREIAIIRNFIPSGDVESFFIKGNYYAVTRTYWSYGIIGKHYHKDRKYVNDKYGWAASYSKVIMMEASKSTPQVRCVKDVKE